MNTVPGSNLSVANRQCIGPWYQDNVVANQAAVALAVDGAVGAYSTSALIMKKSGSLLSVCVKTNDARTAGSLTAEVYKNGAGTGLTAVLDGASATFTKTSQARGTDTFVAGDDIDVRITTDAGWLPITADILAYVEIES